MKTFDLSGLRHGCRTAIFLAATSLLVASWGCAPRRPNPELMAARADYEQVRSDPQVRRSAPAQLDEADRVLRRAEQMWRKGEDEDEVEHLVDLGRSQLQVAKSMAAYDQARQQTEAELRRLEAERRALEAEPTLESSGPQASPLEVRALSAADGSVDGTLTNTSDKPVTDVKLMVKHAWLWKNEFHPGDTSPSRVEYFQIPEQIPPGGSVSFIHRPSVPLPTRADGHFETSLEVVAFDEIHEHHEIR